MARGAFGMAGGAFGMAGGASGMAGGASGMARGASGMAGRASGMAGGASGTAVGASEVTGKAIERLRGAFDIGSKAQTLASVAFFVMVEGAPAAPQGPRPDRRSQFDLAGGPSRHARGTPGHFGSPDQSI
jgi:putative membrane protein